MAQLTGALLAAALGFCLAAGSASAAQWRIQPFPRGERIGLLSSVSCASRTACMAVGFRPPGAIAERWNGHAWSRVPTPDVPSSFLRGVFCRSRNSCVAVGDREDSGKPSVAVIEHWDGNGWRAQSAPDQPGVNVSLWAVSCSAPASCIAVGEARPAFGSDRPLVERWDGTRWSIQAVPGPVGDATLTGVSCPSRRACVAVGFVVPSHGPARAVIEGWNGQHWTLQQTPRIPGGSRLNGIFCLSARACTAVGLAGSALVERWDGTHWTVKTLRPSRAVLEGVACTSKTQCTAVGATNDETTLAERFSGGRWTIQKTPNPPANDYYGGSTLNSVSCPSTSFCIAVGEWAEDGINLRNLAEVFTPAGRGRTRGASNVDHAAI